MPTYSYACTVCDHTFDVRQSFTDESLKDCPVCFDSSLRKVIHPVGISFKGSGFYKTDSRSAKSATSPSTSTGGSTSATSSGDSGSSTSSGDSGGSSATAPSASPGASSTGAASAASTAS
ncbi:MAG TPA: FmdB family zinc ribbon protein [Dermatophilaceae bacterium]|nr:FmdB family zinc ribbon protein [Dermatophilaceae bacterium]